MDRASLRSVETQPGIPAEIAALPDGAAGLLVEFQAARRDRARPTSSGVAADTAGGLRLQSAATVHARAARAGAALEDPRGHVPVGRRGAAQRHDGDHRGRRVPGRGARRRGRRPHAPVPRARLPQRDHLRPREGREPALRPDAVVQRPGGHRPVRPLHRRRGGAGRGPLRRRAEGRARDGPQHGAVRRGRVGRRRASRSCAS